jgi:hypothetical protein
MSTTTSSDLDRLRSELTGTVFGPDDRGAADEAAGNNVAFGVHSTVVAARTTEDVAAAVRHATRQGLPVAVQATGHGRTEPIDDAVLVSTRAMTDVVVDPDARTARVQAGSRWSHVQAAAEPFGLSGLVGSSSQVGVVGFTLGGGHSPVFGRRHGYAADLVRSIELVTADGAVRRVDPETTPDLFWAIRGGKGNFGIVTALEFDLVPAESIYGGSLFFPISAAPEILRAFPEWSSALPDETSPSIGVMRFPPLPDLPEPLRGQAVVQLRYSHLGDPDEAERLLAPMRGLAEPILDGLRPLSTTETDAVHLDPTDPLPFVYRGTAVRDLPGPAVDALLAEAGPDAATPLLMVEVRRLGGALALQPRIPNAVPAREAAFSVFTLGVLMPEIASLLPGASLAVMSAVAPWSTGEVALNFAGSGLGPQEVLGCFRPSDRQRLQTVKQAVDPGDMFRFGGAIGV